jgi:Zn ribbon nucleic-acid-binding protein
MTDLSYGPFISCKQAKAQGLKHYYTGKPCKRDHVDIRFVSGGVCCTCSNDRTKQWQKENSERVNEWTRAIYAKNPQKQIDRVRRYQIANPDVLDRSRKKSYEKLKHTEAFKEAQKRRTADWLKRNPRATAWENMTPHRKLTVALRSRFKRLVIDGKGKGGRELLGCSVLECRKHLERQFWPGMSWDNYGEWHVDHIRPCASFEDPADPRCWHFTNLQPLWAAENLAKSDKWVPVAT